MSSDDQQRPPHPTFPHHPGAVKPNSYRSSPQQPAPLQGYRPPMPRPPLSHQQAPHYAKPSYGYTPPYGAPIPEVAGATTSLVMGILSLVLVLVPVLGLGFGLWGAFTGSSAKTEARVRGLPASTAQGGYVCSMVGLWLGVAYNGYIFLVDVLLA